MDKWQRYLSLSIQRFYVRLSVCPSHYIHVAFLFQSPDRKKVLTTQRTFDSEGEEKPICFVVRSFLSLSSKHFISKLQHVLPKKYFVLQRRSSTRTTRRRPYIMTQTRMPIPESPNLTMALWSNTDQYAPPGASSVWSGIILTSSSPLSLHLGHRQTYVNSGLCLLSLGMLVLSRMLSKPVWSQSIPILPLFLPSSAPHAIHQGVQEHFFLD